ncbi:MAG TPA: hypothetical protein VF103_12200 [Polyangiaceae bacterium]
MSRAWKTLSLSLIVVFSSLAVAACSDDPPLCPAEEEEDEGADVGPSTGATCNGSTLDYDGFGKPFMEKYCTSCHSSTVKGEEARHCAPDDHNFDTLDEIVFTAKHMDQVAAAGPAATNDEMPPNGNPKPTAQERLDLGTWLACEVERMP